jgi:pimeloyl-ACP methyl ester carboxylesterase
MSALFAERGGEGERLLVLLHGMGASAAVWNPFIKILNEQWRGRWIAPDFRGHGRSVKEGPYTFEQHAKDVGALIAAEGANDTIVLGHSFGGVIAALVGSGAYGVRPSATLGVGVKIRWTEEEKIRALDLANRPVKVFTKQEEAIERFLKMSGLFGLVSATSAEAQSGVVVVEGGWTLAQDPSTFLAVSGSVPDALRRADPPIRLAAGSKDPMVTLDHMKEFDADAHVIEGVGHNAHVEAPEAVWQFLKRVILQ